eukprot:TRINITY_DN27392_c0_g1_i2.p1 TRINITY_DN27392_c0_g1~~TRINITY_DN27392_c0_g1_i2.p1  ORF type:complete len:133 (-),score=31.26 TRINITY_DN27392_c0_g1_i2:136-534(-)
MQLLYLSLITSFFLRDTATTEINTLHIVGSVRCVQETDQRRVHGSQDEKIEKYVGKSEFYFYLESYNQNMNLFDRYLYAFKEGTKFPYDFGRQILCEIFSVKKTNWKECQLMPQEIAQQVEELKINLNYKKM